MEDRVLRLECMKEARLILALTNEFDKEKVVSLAKVLYEWITK